MWFFVQSGSFRFALQAWTIWTDFICSGFVLLLLHQWHAAYFTVTYQTNSHGKSNLSHYYFFMITARCIRRNRLWIAEAETIAAQATMDGRTAWLVQLEVDSLRTVISEYLLMQTYHIAGELLSFQILSCFDRPYDGTISNNYAIKRKKLSESIANRIQQFFHFSCSTCV